MSHQLTFFDFKRKHGLGYSDIQKITGCSLTTAQKWTSGDPVPDYIIQMINGIDVVIDRIKTDNGIFTDVDAQHAAHIMEKLNKEIKALKATIPRLQSNQVDIRGPEDAVSLVYTHKLPDDVKVTMISSDAELSNASR